MKYQIIVSLEDVNFGLTKNKQIDTGKAFGPVYRKLKNLAPQWESELPEVDFSPIETITSSKFNLTLVGTTAHISRLENPITIDLEEPLVEKLGLKRSRINTAAISICHEDQEIKCLNLCDENAISNARALVGKRVRVIGVPILLPVQKRKSQTHFYIVDIREQTSQIEVLMPSKAEISWAAKWVDQQRTKQVSLVDRLESKAVTALNIQLEGNEIIRKIIRFVILMALSGGRGENMIFSLNLLLIGRAGGGKKIATSVLGFLSPIFEEPYAARLNKVGMVGSASLRDGKWSVNPGYLPRASGGSIAIQDAHAIDDMKSVMDQISMAGEDGFVKCSNAAMTDLEAVVAILMDINRKSQITGEEKESEFDDLYEIPVNVLTRFDGIVDIPPDVERQMDVAVDMIRNYRSGGNAKLKDEQRQAKLVVAYVKDLLPTIDIPAKVLEYAAKKLRSYFHRNQDAFNRYPNLGDFQLRMSNSFIKLVTVVARAHFRERAVISDVDEATEYLQFKVEYLASMAEDLTAAPLVASIKDKPKYRQAFLKTKFAGKTIAFITIYEIYQSEFGFAEAGLKEKVYRDLRGYQSLKGIAEKRGRGLWKFKSPKVTK